MTEPSTVVALGEVLWDLFPDGPRFGGAPANFVHHASMLGAEVWMITGVGNDRLGVDALARLRDSAVRLDHVLVSDQYPTGSVKIELNAKGEASYQFGEDEAWDHLQWSDAMGGLAGHCDAVCFGTLGQRASQSRRVIEQFVAGTRESCLRVLDLNLRPPYIDPAVIDSSLQLANVLKMNDSELDFLADHLSLNGVTEGARVVELCQRLDLRAIAVTQGERGAILHRDGVTVQVESQSVDLVDTVGAGDAFGAVIVSGLVAGAELDEIGRRACRVAEYVCSRSGATPRIPTDILPRFSAG